MMIFAFVGWLSASSYFGFDPLPKFAHRMHENPQFSKIEPMVTNCRFVNNNQYTCN